MKTDRCDGDFTRPQHWISGRRNILRAGFGLMLGLLAFSMFQAYRMQSSLSEEAVEIYHAHVRQDDLITRLRRTLWLGANLTRDLMVHPVDDVQARFQAELRELRAESHRLLQLIDELPEPVRVSGQLRVKTEEFWSILAQAPEASRAMVPAARYDFIQREIVLRRNAVGDLVREFAKLGQDALQESEREFSSARRAFANRLLMVLAFCLFLGGAVAVFSVLHAENLERRNVEQYRQVQRMNTDLQQLSGRLMEVQEQERIHLARELHDEIGQMVATVRMEVAQAASLPESGFPEILTRLARAKDLAGKTVAAVRGICLWLRPTMLDDLGLVPAVQWQIEQFERRTGILVEFQEKNVSEDVLDSAKTCVYRVLQEALHNCEKHAGATQVCVLLSGTDGELFLEVKDDGSGFRTDSRGLSDQPGCFGLLGMRERAFASNGILSIESAPREGTRIKLCIPAVVPAECSKTIEVQV